MDDERVLYHYTDVGGACGMITSQSVWMSDCRYLNDVDELNKALKVFQNHFSASERKAIGHALNWWSYRRSYCVFSLSKSAEILSQWRAYANKGKGMVLGFSSRFLSSPSIGNVKLVDCVYENHEEFLRSAVDEQSHIVNEIMRIYREDSAINIFWKNLDKSEIPIDELYAPLLRVKNSAFKEECEVRLVTSVPVEETKSRVSGDVVIPYVEKTLLSEDDRDYLSVLIPEVWLGPQCDERNRLWLQSRGNISWIGDGVKKFDCGFR